MYKMPSCIDLRCPWCGEDLANTGTTMYTYSKDLDDHVKGCDAYQEESR